MNNIVLVALAVLIPSCLGSLIVGGHESVAHSRPYQVAIMTQYKSQYCGGSLVHEKWVVTAAHCTAGEGKPAHVGLGYHAINKHSGPNQQFITGIWRVNLNFNNGGQSFNNDIALIELNTPATTNSDVKIIRISPVEPYPGMEMLVSGWGNRDPSTWDPPIELNEVVVFADTYQRCSKAYGLITPSMFCASVKGGGKDSCQGDSGGPIVSNFAADTHQDGVLLNGIVSFGWGCAEATHPGVYTKIANYCTWLNTTSNGDVNCV